MTAPIIQTPDFTLRPFLAADASAVATGISAWNVIRMLTSPPHPYAHQDAVDHIDRVKDDAWHWLIDIDGPAGSIAVDNELGYWLAEPHWGKGIMTQAATEVLDVYFDATDNDSVPSGYLYDNPASWRVQEKLGFVHTGEKQVHAHSRGGLVRSIRTKMTRDVWQRRRLA